MSFLIKSMAGKDAGKEYLLQTGENLVGRSRSAQIRVFNEDVSGRHFVLEVSRDGVILKNLSSYGTKLDGVLVHKTTEIVSGQCIEAGKNTKFIFEEYKEDAEGAAEDESLGEHTGVTRFAADIGTVHGESASAAEEATSVTRFASGEEVADEGVAEDATSVTRFASGEEVADEGAAEDATSVTRFASASESSVEGTANETQLTSVEEKTSVNTVFANDVENITHNEEKSGSASEEQKMNETAAQGNFFFGKDDEKKGKDSTSVDNSTYSQTAPGINNTEDNVTEEGMFFEDVEEEPQEDSEKTSVNETQIVQTRMASMDEINFIKQQIKKQQQSRLFFKILVLVLFVVLLGVIWIMKAPQQEKILSWPSSMKNGKKVYSTGFYPEYNEIRKRGSVGIYYPLWKNTKIKKSGNNVIVYTYLGKNADVPLILYFSKEVSKDFLYESRELALKNALLRLSDPKNKAGLFNFEQSTSKSFLGFSNDPAENAVLCDTLAYQRDDARSWFGMLRFVRNGNENYILRAEVPAEEKLRAVSLLTNDKFFQISRGFGLRNWQGSNIYQKDINVKVLLNEIGDTLQKRISPMLLPQLELGVRNVLAKSLYEGNAENYKKAMKFLLSVRDKQYYWYNEQRVRWARAKMAKNDLELRSIRNDSEAVFQLDDDKRRADILRDHWE